MSFTLNKSEYFAEHFTRQDFSAQVIEDTVFEECTFPECNFSNAQLMKCRLTDCQFSNCNLSVLIVKGSKFQEVQFDGCKLVGVDWTKAVWPNLSLSAPLHFSHCILNDSVFFGLNLAELVLRECKAHDVDFREGNFQDAVFTGTDFTYAQFNHSNLSRADFSGAENFSIDVNFNTVKGARFSRFEAVSLLEGLGIELVD